MAKFDRKKLARLSLYALVAVCVIALLYVAIVPRPIAVDEARVIRGTLIEIIRTDAVLRAKTRYTVPAFAEGDIKRVDLKVGDAIKKDQPITELYWDLKYEPVRSPLTGVLSKIYRESAGPIHGGEPIVEVVDPEHLEAVAELLTTDAARVHLGNTAIIHGWGGTETLNARVTRISKAAFTKQSALGVEEERTEVTLDLNAVPASIMSRVGSGFHIEVVIELSRHDHVLKVPAGAVFRDGKNWAVYRNVEHRARSTQVSIGAQGEQETVITSGLSEGETVIVYPGDLIKEGARIKPSANNKL